MNEAETQDTAPEAEMIEETVTETIEPAADAAPAVDATVDAPDAAADAVVYTGGDVNSGIDGMLSSLGESSIYLMGLSFILGSLFTILVLILLDYMRRNQAK